MSKILNQLKYRQQCINSGETVAPLTRKQAKAQRQHELAIKQAPHGVRGYKAKITKEVTPTFDFIGRLTGFKSP